MSSVLGADLVGRRALGIGWRHRHLARGRRVDEVVSFLGKSREADWQ